MIWKRPKPFYSLVLTCNLADMQNNLINNQIIMKKNFFFGYILLSSIILNPVMPSVQFYLFLCWFLFFYFIVFFIYSCSFCLVPFLSCNISTWFLFCLLPVLFLSVPSVLFCYFVIFPSSQFYFSCFCSIPFVFRPLLFHFFILVRSFLSRPILICSRVFLCYRISFVFFPLL